MKVKSESEVTQSCLTLMASWTAAYQAPPSMGFSRQEYRSGVPVPSPINKFKWSLIQCHWCIYKKVQIGTQKDMHRWKTMSRNIEISPCEGRRLEWCIHKPRNAKNCQQVIRSQEVAWNWFCLTTLRRNQPCQHVDFGLLASRTVRQ